MDTDRARRFAVAGFVLAATLTAWAVAPVLWLAVS